MSFETETTTLRQEAVTLRTGMDAAIARTKGNVMISEHAKQIEIRDSYTTARTKMDALANKEKNLLGTSITGLETKLFGYTAGADIASRRDATDRARKLATPAEALTAYNDAKSQSDEVLIKAIANVSDANGWASVLNAYLDDRPADYLVLSELNQLRRHRDDTGRMIVAGSAYVLLKPLGMAVQ
jgi:hypothetical protein